jgi:uncharacterized RmlC-like cupin family protein
MTTTLAEHPAPFLRDPMDKGQYQMEIRALTPAQMRQRVARFDELKYPPDRYPDSHLPGRERKNYLVVGRGLKVAGAKDPMSAIPVSEGFQLSYAKVRPGNGPQLHNHDSNETFVAIKGTWRVFWGLGQANSVDLKPLDVCSVPAFVPRTFICLSTDDGEDEGVIMAVIAGDAPNSEFN